MNLFDNNRPEASPERPALVPSGSAVPGIYVWPRPDGENVELRTFLPTAPNNYSAFYAEIKLNQLGDFFTSYFNNPEKTLEVVFGWQNKAFDRPRRGGSLGGAQPPLRLDPSKPLPKNNDAGDVPL